MVGRWPAPVVGLLVGAYNKRSSRWEILGREEWPDTLLGPETTGPLLPLFVGWETPLRWGWWGLLLPHRFWWWGVVFDLWIVVASI